MAAQRKLFTRPKPHRASVRRAISATIGGAVVLGIVISLVRGRSQEAVR